MNDSTMISTRIEKEYNPIRNEWETRIQFITHDNALYSGFLAEIPPMHLHTLICLSLFMKDNGKIEISVADLARALGISFQLAKKRIDELIGFRFQGQPVVHINKTRDANDKDRVSLSILPVSPITFVDEREESKPESFSPKNSDYLFEFSRLTFGLDRLSEQEKELLVTLQNYPYELPPQVIEVLVEHVKEYKQVFDQQYIRMLASSWSSSGILTRKQAEKRVEEMKKVANPAKAEAPEAYLLQYLRERIRKQPSAVQINMIFQLLEEPFQLEPGCIEVLIDHVAAQITLTKGKPDFPKKYVEVVVQDWLERGVRTREAAIQEVEEWNKRYSMKPTDSLDKKEKNQMPSKTQGFSKVKSEYLDKLRKAGLK
ncbi:DnaD domain protein [Effusibacillus consociatus]|uniref:DnaD domain protein n=1 Tax=Effusibacillus consociatus TaxID=1117041 RepID=A0ABV9Q548_9BACL